MIQTNPQNSNITAEESQLQNDGQSVFPAGDAVQVALVLCLLLPAHVVLDLLHHVPATAAVTPRSCLLKAAQPAEASHPVILHPGRHTAGRCMLPLPLVLLVRSSPAALVPGVGCRPWLLLLFVNLLLRVLLLF